ncbi:MAG: hypothetical protein PHW39_04305 [Syntrophomonadaceae bacterium]|nr:hypothetical protein [Syntrophomonadaceae bacterium]
MEVNYVLIEQRKDLKNMRCAINIYSLPKPWIQGKKVGVLSPNGYGKTTLVKLILSMENPDDAKLFLSRSARVAYVSQELPRDEKENLKSLVKD